MDKHLFLIRQRSNKSHFQVEEQNILCVWSLNLEVRWRENPNLKWSTQPISIKSKVNVWAIAYWVKIPSVTKCIQLSSKKYWDWVSLSLGRIHTFKYKYFSLGTWQYWVLIPSSYWVSTLLYDGFRNTFILLQTLQTVWFINLCCLS